MKISSAIAVTAMVAGALLAGGASAQKPKVAPAQIFYDGAYEVPLPADGATTTLKLEGLKSAHGAWLTFVKFAGGAAQETQVITLMEGAMVKWAGGKETCVYELRLVANPPAVTMTKPSGACALKPPGDPVFRVLAM